jgi:hypothetical protein
MGVYTGSTFTAPWVVAGLNGAFSVLPYTYFDLGVEAGFIHNDFEWKELSYFSLYPYARFNAFIPVYKDYLILYAGIGGGCMLSFYSTPETTYDPIILGVMDVITGIYIGKGYHYCNIAYSLRTDFAGINSKVILGYSFRFNGGN